MGVTVGQEAWVGRAVTRFEDEALLRGQGRFIDDLDPVANVRHAAILRSQLAHARIARLDASAALGLPGVVGVLTGADVAAMSRPLPAGVETGIPYYAAAPEVARYAGEPLAVVVARERYVAEDALELIEVEYEPLAPVLDQAAAPCVSDRRFAYGRPDEAFAAADLVVRERFAFPRWSAMPVECYGVIADWDEAAGSLTAWANFQGPFTLHAVAAAALGLPGSKLRIVTPPDSGGSFGVKSTIYVYITLAQTAEERARGLPKSGNAEGASVAVSPLGGITVRIGTTPQGQGHRTVCAQVVADQLGVRPDEVEVLTDLDTSTSAWTVSSGNYSSRFAGMGAGAVHKAAGRLAAKLRAIAAHELGCAPDEVELRDGAAHGRGESISLRRLAGVVHWNPDGLPPGIDAGLHETAFHSQPGLAPPDGADRVASAAAHGFVVDVAVVEVERATGAVRVLDYVTVHDAGRLLNPLLAEGQIRGGFAHGAGAALFERIVHDEDGNLLTGTFMDYLCPTAPDLPTPRIGHRESPSPFTPLGAKGLGEGNTMSVPAAIANAVADAIGVDDLGPPLTPPRVWELLR